MAEVVAVDATARPKTSLVDSFVGDLQRLVNRNGGDGIDTVSLFLVQRIVNDVALLLNVDESFMKDAVGVTRILALKGKF